MSDDTNKDQIDNNEKAHESVPNGDIDYRDSLKPIKKPKIDKMGLEVTKNPLDVKRSSKKILKIVLGLALLLALVGGAYFAYGLLSNLDVNMGIEDIAQDPSEPLVDNDNEPQTTQTPRPQERRSVFGELLRKYVTF